MSSPAKPASFIYFRPAEMRVRLPVPGTQNVRLRDAATLIVFDNSGGELRVLMGQRHLTHKFLPGKFVFPGGRVEPQDYLATVAAELPDAMTGKLLHHIRGIPHPQRALAMAHAAIRETREETGVIVGANDPRLATEDAPSPIPDFTGLIFVGRAVTPPRRPRRFDTRFFAISAEAISGHLGSDDGEFIGSQWLTMDEARNQDLPVITRAILSEFEARVKAGNLSDPLTPVPFYFMRGACFHRWTL